MKSSNNSSESKKYSLVKNLLVTVLPVLSLLGYGAYTYLTKIEIAPLSDLVAELDQLAVDAPKAPLIESIVFGQQKYDVFYKNNGSNKKKKKRSFYALPGTDQSKIRERIDTINLQLAKTDATKKIAYKVEEFSEFNWQMLLGNILPMLILPVGLFWMMRQMQRGASGMMESKQKNIANLPKDQKITFDDVAGIEEPKEELVEIVDFLKDPSKYTKLGAKIPKGILLAGLPGTGKTLLAKAIAGEANVPFYSMSGSEFEDTFVGVGASRIRELFEEAKKHAPAIIFIDEIDSIGRRRGIERMSISEQTLNQLLVEMDGFDTNSGIILIGATNRADVLDPALLRSGRFDRHIYIPSPDVKGRQAILKVHCRNIPIDDSVNLATLARETVGFSGAELASLINEAVIISAKRNLSFVTDKELAEAKQKIMLGAERRSLVLSDEVRNMTAYHEAGHALTARFIEGLDPVHMITIIPRARALGLTEQLPTEDRFNVTKEWVLGTIAVCMGGRAAEQLIFGHITTGSQNDLEKATLLARKMVCSWGMSDVIGPLSLSLSPTEIVSAHTDLAGPFDHYSEQTALLIDKEVKSILDAQYSRSVGILEKHRDLLDRLAKELLAKETLHAEDIREIVG